LPRCLQDGAIDLMAEFDHRLRLVQIIAAEQPGTRGSQRVLGRDQNLTRALPAPGDVEQTEQHA
jgi:hypothetical protein